MRWWQKPELLGHVTQALTHLNEARAAGPELTATRLCELRFHALNNLWTALADLEGQAGRADTPSFISLLSRTPVELRPMLLRTQQLASLAAFTPEVLDHDVLRRRGYRPGKPIPDVVRREASERHRKLRARLANFLAGQPEATADRVLKRLAEFLYVVRSNIAHGEKTPYGPDLEKTERDETVSRVTVPILDLIVDLLLDRPSHKLVAYGTIRPGGANQTVLDAVQGHWVPCRIPGHLRERDGLSLFRWDPAAQPVEAMLLYSSDLEQQWRRLDQFEGQSYRRTLVPAHADGVHHIANVYEEASLHGAG